MNLSFEGKVALVTGAAAGIGLATARAFAQAGASVMLADVDAQAAQKAARELTGQGFTAASVHCDVSQEDSVADMIEQTVALYGRLDCAFNNAGVMSERAETTLLNNEEWDRVLNINLRGAWFCMKHELLHMQKQGSGSVVNASSIGGLAGVPGLPAYIASKHGLIGLTRSAALENASRGIRVNAVCPGTIRTPMVEKMIADDPSLEKAFIDSEPAGRLGTPEEIAAAVLWLSAPDAAFVTGHALAVDGGYTAR